MPRKQSIEFTNPIAEPVTKFGGQPVWIDEPVRPLSRVTGSQMRFIGQVELHEEEDSKRQQRWLRHTHKTELLHNGVTLAETTKLPRHSDVRMTMRYAPIGIDGQAKAVQNLPRQETVRKSCQLFRSGRLTD